MLILIGIISVLASLCYIYSKSIYSYWKNRKVATFPGASLPFGNFNDLLTPKAEMVGMRVANFYKYFKENGYKHGGVYLFATPVYIPIDLELCKRIMTQDYHHFEEKGLYYNERDQPINAHLFNLGGQRWKKLRTKLTPAFTSGKLKTMYPIIFSCSLQMLNKVSEFASQQESFELKALCSCFTMDTIGSCAFGIDCNSLKEPDSEFCKIGRKTFHLPLYMKLMIPLMFGWAKLCAWLRIVNFPAEIVTFYTKIITDTVKYRQENNVKRRDFVQMLMEIKEKGEISMQDIINQAFIIFVAGFETSSTAISHCLLELCINMEIQENARQEILKVLKNHNNELTYECVNDMKYLEQCIQETLRKYPAVPILNRACSKEYQVPDTDAVLEVGTKIYIPVMAIHYDPEYYPDPHKFDPDRFSDENMQKRHHYTWLPFGEGPRICIGLRFGILQTKICLIQLLTNFRFNLAKEMKFPIIFDNHSLLLHAKDDIIVTAEKL